MVSSSTPIGSFPLARSSALVGRSLGRWLMRDLMIEPWRAFFSDWNSGGRVKSLWRRWRITCKCFHHGLVGC